MENFDKEISILDDLINQNENKLNSLSGKVNNLSNQISYMTLEQMGYIKNVLSDKKFKDGLNLTFMKKMFAFLKKLSFIGTLGMLVAFFFNVGIPFALSTLFMTIIYYVCKDKHIEYADMISRYEVAINQYYLDECKVDLSLVREKKQEVEAKINDLKEERELFNEEILVVRKIIEKIIESKKQLLNNNEDENYTIDLNEYLVNKEKRENILIKKL